jgi:hypothetical protein
MHCTAVQYVGHHHDNLYAPWRPTCRRHPGNETLEAVLLLKYLLSKSASLVAELTAGAVSLRSAPRTVQCPQLSSSNASALLAADTNNDQTVGARTLHIRLAI